MLISKLIEKLSNPRHEHYVREALASYGTAAEAQLATVLADGSDIQKQIAVVKVLGEIHTATAANILGASFQDPHDHLRAAVAKALANLQTKGVAVHIPRADILQATLDEIKRTYSIHLILADLGVQGGKILVRVLQDHLGYILDHLFSLLSLLYPDLDMRAIHTAVKSGGGQKITALELIDAMADKEIREVMLPLVEAPQERIVQIALARFGLRRLSVEQRLAELVQSDDPVLRAFALYQLGLLGLDSLSEAIHQNLDYNHPLVQETALWAVMFASPNDAEVRPLLKRQTNSQFPAVRTYAERLLKETMG